MSAELLERPFGTIGELIRHHARRDPRHAALIHGDRRMDYGELDQAMDQVAASLHRDGVARGDRIAVRGPNSIEQAVLFLGALRAGVVTALVPHTVSDDAAEAMRRDSGAKLAFEGEAPGAGWIGPATPFPEPAIAPADAFNIIYSSGTTGMPKGIVQPHAMRWAHMQRALAYHYDAGSITLLSTPLYSNTTLVSFFPTLAMGGSVVLMHKFDPAAYLEIAQSLRVTHTMLVPVQYQRLMALPEFGRHDLSSFRMKLSTSARFAPELKREVLERWPGELVEYYGTTEGGATCILWASRDRHKLHTVGKPAANVELRLIDEDGREVPAGEAGEVVGHSVAMMTGYHNRAEATREAEWFDAAGRRFMRTGDVGRFDEDGFLVLVDRRKDLIISGGFNIYPSDLEAVLLSHPGVLEAAVVPMRSARWGETPAAFAVARPGAALEAEALRAFANERLGKTQRIALVRLLGALPRSPIGKVLKRDLRKQLDEEDGRPE